MTPAEVADAVFSPLTRDAPLPVGVSNHFWPHALDDTFYVPVGYAKVIYDRRMVEHLVGQDA